MANLFRSKQMTYVRITMINEAAQLVVSALGEFGKLHLRDLSERENPNTQYLGHKKRVAYCQFWDKKLQMFREVLERYNVEVPVAEDDWEEKKGGDSGGDTLREIQDFLEPIEKELATNIQYCKEEESQISDLKDFMEVLRVVGTIGLSGFSDDEYDDAFQGKTARSLSIDSNSGKAREKESIQLLGASESGLITGVILQSQQQVFHRSIYRISKGSNSYIKFIPFDAEDMVGKAPKSVFYIKTVGNLITSKVLKMCKVLGVRTFQLPDDMSVALLDTEQDISFKENVLVKTQEKIKKLLRDLAGSASYGGSPLLKWEAAIKKERMTCQTLMMCSYHMQIMDIEGWCPDEAVDELKQKLRQSVSGMGLEVPAILTEREGINPPAGSTRPTYIPKNKFTAPFQVIVDTYGVPRYQEANPGLFTCVTFPFLFGVMYGDIFHGFCILAYGLYLIFTEQKQIALIKAGKMGEMGQGMFGGRYCLALMGFFAFYCGWIYNDFASNTVPLFPSTWGESADEEAHYLEPTGGVYPFGIDHGWMHHTSSLIFVNSLKMKMAVTLGVTQMIFGICLSLTNHLFFKDDIKVLFEFLPRIIFMLFTFGYMIFLIVYKLSIDWAVFTDTPRHPPAPNLIQVMINMFLSPGKMTEDLQLFADADAQKGLQQFLLFTALLMVPLMFLGVPLIKHYCGAQKHPAHYHAVNSEAAYDEELGKEELLHSGSQMPTHDDDHSDEHGLGDEMIHNGIHSIEFVLGCVSNTASYLRLWALSLAHAQLAEVFWRMTIMQYGLQSGLPSLMIVAGVAAWMCLTFAVLLTMDVLECFLHALRLHWVEFQNKFYAADGVAYEPFVFSPARLF